MKEFKDEFASAINAAIEHLKPSSKADRARCEETISGIIADYRECEPHPQVYKKDIERLRKLAKKMHQSADQLDQLKPDEIRMMHSLIRTCDIDQPWQVCEVISFLQELSGKLDDILDYHYTPMKRGSKTTNFAKNRLVRECVFLFDKSRPDDAETSERARNAFVQDIYDLATADEIVKVDPGRIDHHDLTHATRLADRLKERRSVRSKRP